MAQVSTDLIKKAIYELCFKANICLSAEVYQKIYNAFNLAQSKEEKNILKSILMNAKIAFDKKMPLCQDTGQVIVFLKIGQDVQFKGEYINDVINQAVSDCYSENYFRKSVVKNAVFDRNNTKTNTPVIIYSEIVEGDEVEIKVLIKGAGSENKSALSMELPTIDTDELVKNIGNLILKSGINACPPMFIGIGIGSTAESAMLLSKKALVNDNFSDGELNLADKIKNYVNLQAKTKFNLSYVLDVKALTSATHIACMPVGITINCHSDRTSSCIIKNNEVFYQHKIPEFIELEEHENDLKEVLTDDVASIRDLKTGEEILLSGEIFVARDMAHKRLIEMLDKNEKLPIEIKDKIIFYAGPCPNKTNEIIGSVGPTTSGRMDKYAVELYNRGLLATIGKGDRGENVKNVIARNRAKYFSVVGGIAALLAQKVIYKEVIAFDDLGAEALFKLKVSKLPVKVELA